MYQFICMFKVSLEIWDIILILYFNYVLMWYMIKEWCVGWFMYENSGLIWVVYFRVRLLLEGFEVFIISRF